MEPDGTAICVKTSKFAVPCPVRFACTCACAGWQCCWAFLLLLLHDTMACKHTHAAGNSNSDP